MSGGRGKRLWFKVDALFFEETGGVLTETQQVAFLRLIAACKRRSSAGHFTFEDVRREGVNRRSLYKLIDEGFVVENGDGWVIRTFVEWQGDPKKRSDAGRIAAEARWSRE